MDGRDGKIIRVENVSTTYEGEKRPAIRGVNLALENGELVYLVGPNAAGKTTLLETINGLQPVSKGEVSVLGLDVRGHGSVVRKEIGYVPQDFMVEALEPYTALDVAMMGRYAKMGVLRRPEKEDFKKAMEALGLLGVEELACKPVGKLSGGQQQKVMISRALAKEPKVLLLDEPFSNLDPSSRQEVSALVCRLNEERKMATIVVTHDIRQIPERCRRIVVMNGGRIVADESPEKALAALESCQNIGAEEAVP
ncbi:MAG: ABC transporter ATP-binding protein [Candidatus Brockarchaeota archaeon]|nr:ABC transporter ATP-binding protein [Candidatus Brockarchaeota archaeon]